VKVGFLVSSMEDAVVGESEYDVVISMAAMGYIENIEPIFRKIGCGLKENGVFVCSFPHAAFHSITSKYLFNDPPEHHNYFHKGQLVWKWEDGDDYEFYSYCRPVGDYLNLLISSGLSIRCVLELQELHEQVESAEDEFDALYPKMLVIKAIKP